MSPRTISVFTSRRMAALSVLGFASGLPYALTTDTLQAWLATAKVDIAQIGLFGLVAFPYALKFVWAPLMDRFVPPLLGRRRGWLLVTQVLLIGAIFAMGMTSPSANSLWVAIAALAVAFFSASQDIVGDAYRTDVLEEEEMAAGAGVWVTAYRLALIVSGAGVLYLVGKFGFSFGGAYVVMGMVLTTGLAATLAAPEPMRAPAPPRTLWEAVVDPLVELTLRPRGWVILLLVVLFTLPEVLAKGMSLPFLREMGFALTDIANVRQLLGIVMTILGTLTGGALATRLGLRKSLYLFSLLGAVSNLGFLVLAEAPAGMRYGTMVVVLGVENFCVGLVTAGFLAFLMAQCDSRYSATQYALLSSLVRLTDILSRPLAGWVIGEFGWACFFLVSVLMAIPGLGLLYAIRGLPLLHGIREHRPERGIEVATARSS